ncbi:hypothetical protein [Corynebacterium glyciniphilum]|uniref:hypothetical protein n=1 Tax=Corynebacterium glyciniphilum TaxID=1404244 RepID=UPI002651CF5E|nr:hypothetical protein [Corynebacterium glyciniphilum]MDN6706169.1 hypothetical protein [Corynebacterium glyciniphilum]
MTKEPIFTVGVMVDRGLPEKRVRKVLEKLGVHPDETNLSDDDLGALGLPRVEVRTSTLPMGLDGSVRLSDSAAGIMESHGWDRMIYVTDLPLTTRRPVISQTVDRGRVTMLCLPAFGFLRAQEGLRQELSRLLRRKPAGAGVLEDVSDSSDIEGGDSEADTTRVIDGWGRSLRLLLGMVAGNRPTELYRVLTGCLAIGIATGAYGIFYGSMWQMSHTVSVLRMFVISLVAVGALTFWLIYHNGLWNRWPNRESDSVAKWRARMDNRATLATVLIAAAMIYTTVFGVLLALSIVIVDTNYFRAQVNDEPFPWGYAKLAWLTASLGTMAGAIGSSFDNDEAIREATYNRREHIRRQITGLYEDKPPTRFRDRKRR